MRTKKARVYTKVRGKDDPRLVTKTSLRLPTALWTAAQHRAIDEGIALQDLVTAALIAYLKTPAKEIL